MFTAVLLYRVYNHHLCNWIQQVDRHIFEHFIDCPFRKDGQMWFIIRLLIVVWDSPSTPVPRRVVAILFLSCDAAGQNISAFRQHSIIWKRISKLAKEGLIRASNTTKSNYHWCDTLVWHVLYRNRNSSACECGTWWTKNNQTICSELTAHLKQRREMEPHRER